MGKVLIWVGVAVGIVLVVAGLMFVYLNQRGATEPCDKTGSDNTCFWGLKFTSDYYDSYDGRKKYNQGDCRYVAKWYVEQRELVTKGVAKRQKCDEN